MPDAAGSEKQEPGRKAQKAKTRRYGEKQSAMASFIVKCV